MLLETVCFVYVFTYIRVSPLLNICNLGRWTGYNVNSEPLLLVKVAAAVGEIFQVLQKSRSWTDDRTTSTIRPERIIYRRSPASSPFAPPTLSKLLQE